MSLYRLHFGGNTIGDELTAALGAWKAGKSSASSSNVDIIAPLDGLPLGLVLAPTFRVRKVADSMLAFEQWLFDLAMWADGQRRWLSVLDENSTLKADYGQCKLIAVGRPTPDNAHDGRWSDQIIVTFRSDTTPTFTLS